VGRINADDELPATVPGTLRFELSSNLMSFLKGEGIDDRPFSNVSRPFFVLNLMY
jgi:hypothetical protein